VTRLTIDLIRDRLARHSPRRVLEPGSLEAAVALLLAPAVGEELKLLLIKRAEQRGDPWSGQMALPGGRRDPSDADLLGTAVRETREEVGIEIAPERLLGELDDLHPRTPTLPPVVVRPFVFALDREPAVHLGPEVALHVWVPLSELASGNTRTEIMIPGRDRAFPAYRVGPNVVWGMTERILAPFLELLA
jgi:8-oxo-dGTP pyrophosphatase MutT (NUDIX family)